MSKQKGKLSLACGCSQVDRIKVGEGMASPKDPFISPSGGCYAEDADTTQHLHPLASQMSLCCNVNSNQHLRMHLVVKPNLFFLLEGISNNASFCPLLKINCL